MGRPSASREHKRQLVGTLRLELERHIERGQCASCRAPARPNRPLTREHVIPRARGGRRKDVRIIVPACARCNHNRGCQDLIPFLLRRPERISSFLDYLATISPDSLRLLDLRIFAELYTAIAILNECVVRGDQWKTHLERLCVGRSLHRRRYAARRAVGCVAERISWIHDQEDALPAPSCLVPGARSGGLPLHLEEPLERLASRLITVLALVWQVSAEVVEAEMARALSGSAVVADSLVDPEITVSENAEDPEEEVGVVPLDGWKAKPKRKRVRVDRRGGRAARPQRITAAARGRAA